MKRWPWGVLILLLGGWMPSAHAAYDLWGERLRIEGFGTLGAYQSDNDHVRVRPDSRARAGSEGDLRFDGDTLLAMQGTIHPNGPIKGVVQLVSHKKIDATTYDGSWRPLTEWAYVGWDASPEINLKVGRVVAPLFMMSDTRNLGYAQIAVRPPQTVYQLNPITHLDGAALSWDARFGQTLLNFSGLYGRSSVANSSGRFTANRIYGGAIKATHGNWTARTGVTQFDRVRVAMTAPFRALYNDIRTLPYCANCAATLERDAPLDNFSLKTLSYGLAWEPSNYQVQAEIVNRLGSSLTAPDTYGWYVQAAQRLGSWTPYVRVGKLKNYDTVDLQAAAGAPVQVQSTLAMLNGRKIFGEATRSELALGVRWDIAPKLDLKLEYNRYKAYYPRHGSGVVINYPDTTQATAFEGDKGRVSLMTLTLDFIF